MKKLIVATLLFTALSANAGVVRFAAHHVRHCGPKVVKKVAHVGWKVIY